MAVSGLKAVGYASPLYAQSLAQFGTPCELPTSGGWVLTRPIRGTKLIDAMGCYPVFTCRDWNGLPVDLEARQNEWVSVTLVADPFGCHDQELRCRAFPDLAKPFKDHLVADLSSSPHTTVSKHHRYYARRALSQVTVDIADDPLSHLEEWLSFYDELKRRHGISGIRAFSLEAFDLQLRIEGLVMLRAEHRNAAVGAHLWFLSGGVATSHLAAFSPKGYELNVSYALYWRAFELFAERGVRWLNFGAGAGLGSCSDDGLTRFKRGWSNQVRTAYLCGRVLSPDMYEETLAITGVRDTSYFPAYRAGEF